MRKNAEHANILHFSYLTTFLIHLSGSILTENDEIFYRKERKVKLQRTQEKQLANFAKCNAPIAFKFFCKGLVRISVWS